MWKTVELLVAATIILNAFWAPSVLAATTPPATTPSAGNAASKNTTATNEASHEGTKAPQQQHVTNRKGDGVDVNYPEIMQKCNETYPIPIDYLVELNSTGSFPDETEKTPMCYVKCFLENISVLKADGTVDKVAAEQVWPNSVDAIDDCIKDQAGLFDNDPNEECGKVYYLARCVMMKEVLSSRNTDN